jgi:MoaA/NifB/PqqE/SkfB family radical SAM enzyme
MSNPEQNLNYIHKLLQTGLRGQINEYVEKKRISGPVIVELDPTTSCNFKCPECINEDLLNKGQFEPGRLNELIEQFNRVGVKGLILIGGGEPLAHREIAEAITTAHGFGISIGLTTNGTLLNKYLPEIANYVSWTRVSVDASTEETYEKFRPSSLNHPFLKVIENMKELAKIKKGTLGFSFLLIQRKLENGDLISNCGEVLAAAELARNIGCDYFEFKPMVDGEHRLVPLAEKFRDLLSQQLEKLQALNSDTFSVIAPDSIDPLIENGNVDQPKDYTSCPMLEFRTLVTPKGIYPCPYKRGQDAFKIGEPDVAFDQYWQSTERYEKSRKLDPSKDCLFHCIRHKSNVFLEELTTLFDKGVNSVPFLPETETEDVFI